MPIWNTLRAVAQVVEHPVDRGHAVAQRLFAQNMDIALQRIRQHLLMQIVRRGDHHRVELAPFQHLAIVGEGFCPAGHFLAEAQRLRVRVSDRRNFHLPALQRRFHQMAAAVSRSDHRVLDLFHIGFPPAHKLNSRAAVPPKIRSCTASGTFSSMNSRL